MMGIGNDGGEPVQVRGDFAGKFGDVQFFVAVEEAHHFAIDFIGREGLRYVFHRQCTQGLG